MAGRARLGPDERGQRHRQRGEHHRVRSADHVQQRHHGQARPRAAHQVGAIQQADARRLAGEDYGKGQAGQKERNGGDQVDQRQAQKAGAAQLQRDGNVQHDDQRDNDGDGVERGDGRGERARGPARQPLAAYMGEDAAGAKPEQGYRDRQKREVIEEDDRKQAGERQLQQQAAQAHDKDAGQQRTRALRLPHVDR